MGKAKELADFGGVVTVDSSGNIGINNASPSVRLDVVGAGNVSSRARFSKTGEGALQFGANRDASGCPYIGSENNYALAFITNDTERMRITSAGNLQFSTADAGIVFNKTSAVTNSTLNDYEAGSFTPTITFGGNNAGQTFLSGPNGRYLKIGRYVFIMVGWYFSSKGSSTGNAGVGNLPFTSDNFGFYGSYSPATLTGMTSVTNNTAVIGMGGSQNFAYFYQSDGNTSLTNSNFNNSTYGLLSFSYITAS